MAVISCKNISKRYIIDPILEDISFSIDEGDKIGLIGLNGSGKTSLFNILAGEIHRDGGELFIQRDLKIGYLKQHVKIESDKNIFDECVQVFQYLMDMEEELRKLESEIALEGSKEESKELDKLMNKYGLLSEKFAEENGYGYKSDVRGVLVGLGFSEEDFDKEVNLLSGGQKSRLSLAKLLLEKPDLLLLDEPTNHLDIDAIAWLERFLNDYRGSFLLISHDRYFLDNVVSRIFHLENKNIKIYNTNYTSFMVQRKKDLEILKKQYENQQREVKRQEEIIERFMNYGDARYIKQAQSRQKLLDKMKLVTEPRDEKKSRIHFEPEIKSGRDVLQARDIGKSFDKLHLLNGINFSIYRGDKVGLIGPNGVGKTTLFRIILGLLQMDRGEIQLGHQVFPAYFDQEMDNLNEEKTVLDDIWDDNPSLNIYQLRKLLSQFLFIGDDIFKEISDLSGGEKGRLSLLKLMLSKANFLLMDEPTNHLDIDSKEVLEDALIDYEGSLFVISHDRYFLNRVTNKIFDLTQDGLNEYLGNYDYYLEKKNEVLYEEEEPFEKTRTQVRLERKKEKEEENRAREARRKLIQLEEEIAEKEAALEDIDLALSKPENYDNLEEISLLSKNREDLEVELSNLYEKWISLAK